MDMQARERLFTRPEVEDAMASLRAAIRAQIGCTGAAANYLIRDHFRDVTEPRHSVTRWP